MLRLALTMTRRDWRAGELRFLLLSLIVAVAALTAVGFFVERLRVGLEHDAHQVLAADLQLSSEQPLAPLWQAEAHRRGLRSATTVTTLSMVLAGAAEQPVTRLVALKAVSPAYPLRGQLKLRQGESQVATMQIPAHGTAWVDSGLLRSLNLQPGAKLRLGDSELIVTQVIADEPDRSTTLMVAPRVMIASDDLAATHLLSGGAHASYRLLLAGEAGAVAAFEHWLRDTIQAQKIRGLEITSLKNGGADLRDLLQRAQQFLSLASLLSALLAAVAVALAARRYLLRHQDACAMLRALGMTQNQLGVLFLLEFLVLGVLASLAGVALGFAAHFLFLAYLGSLVARELPPAGWQPAVQGMLAGLMLLIGFALPPLLQLRNVSQLRLLRREHTPAQALSWLAYALAACMFGGLLWWLSGDALLAALTGLGYGQALLLFAGVAWVFLIALQGLRGALPFVGWRFAVNALQRRKGATVVQIVALALGLMAMLCLTVVRHDLLTAWKNATPERAPNHWIINIQPDQKVRVAARLQGLTAEELQPVTRARLLSVNGKALSASGEQAERVREILNRELDISSAASLPPANTLTAGRWLRDGGQPEISVEQELARLLQLKPGDQLTFEIAGQSLTARISSLRLVDWRSRRANFQLLLNARAMQDLPQSWVGALYVPPQDKPLMDRLSQEFPNLSIFDIGSLLQQWQAILDQVAAALKLLFLFTLAAGVLVLCAALAGSHDVRLREAALLRALGASRAQLAQAQWIEYALLGAVAGLLAAGGASALSWTLASFVFKLSWSFSLLIWPLGVLAGAGVALLGSWLGLRRVLRQAPLLSLREI